MKSPQLRIAQDLLFWRAAALFAVVKFVLRWRKLQQVAPWASASKQLRYLIRTSPGHLVEALVAALAITILAGFLVRYLLQPRIARWLAPGRREDVGTPPEFLLAPGEAIRYETRGRRVLGSSGRPGTLALTDRRLWFFPDAWDVEPSALPLGELAEARAVPAPSIIWGLVGSLPDRLNIRADSGDIDTFLVPDPAAVLSRLDVDGPVPAPRTEVSSPSRIA